MKYLVILLLCAAFFVAGAVTDFTFPIVCYGQLHHGANSTCVMTRDVQTYFEGSPGVKMRAGFEWDLGAP
jgi:hypothetical protein